MYCILAYVNPIQDTIFLCYDHTEIVKLKIIYIYYYIKTILYQETMAFSAVNQ